MTSLSLSLLIVAALAVIAVAGLAVWYVARRNRRSNRLRTRFGSEYDRTVADLGGRAKGESALVALEARVEALDLAATLSTTDAARFAAAWQALQARFIDDPARVVVQAGELVRDLMSKLGYPVAEFETNAANVSVDHASVVSNYRAAQAVAVRAERGEADTDALRTAVVHYRVLFNELLLGTSDGVHAV